MKNKLLISLLLFSIGVQAQTPNNTPTRFINGLGAPISSTAPFSSQGFFWWQPSATLKLAVYNGTVWQNLLTETLAGTTYAPLASPALTGVPTAPTATLGTNTTQLATTAFTAAGLALKQNLLSGTGFVKSTAGTISYDNSTYYLASNPNGYTSNTGTVTSFGKVDGFGIVSSVANPATTPVHTIAVDTAQVRSVLNSFSKAQADVRYLKLSPFVSAQTIDGQLTINNSLSAFGRTTTYGLQTLVSSATSATTLTSNQHTISASGTFNISLPSGISFAGQQYVIKNNGSGVITLVTTGGGETIDGSSSYAIGAGESISIAGNYSAGWTKVASLSAGSTYLSRSGTTLSPTNAGDNIITTGNVGATGVVLGSTASPTYSAGKLVYDTSNEALTFYNNDANVSMQIGQESWVRVINNTGSTIANGAVVYVNGSSGGLPTVALAQSNSATTTVGLGLVTESIANGAIGYVTSLGTVNGLNTSGFVVGAVYIDPTTAGALTQTVPNGGNFRYRVGFVTVVDATVGKIHVTPTTAVRDNIVASASLDFPSTGSNSNSTLTITATGASIGDVVSLGVPNGAIVATNHNYMAWVSAANTVSVRLNNNSSTTSIDPSANTFSVRVIK